MIRDMMSNFRIAFPDLIYSWRKDHGPDVAVCDNSEDEVAVPGQLALAVFRFWCSRWASAWKLSAALNRQSVSECCLDPWRHSTSFECWSEYFRQKGRQFFRRTAGDRLDPKSCSDRVNRRPRQRLPNRLAWPDTSRQPSNELAIRDVRCNRFKCRGDDRPRHSTASDGERGPGECH